MQLVDINKENHCDTCGASITHIPNFKYAGTFTTGATYRNEECVCTQCGTHFIMHYELFDPEGHIYSKVFTGDINNLNYNWQELLTKEQLDVIARHLSECTVCQDRLSEEILTDAWFSDFLNQIRKNRNGTQDIKKN